MSERLRYACIGAGGVADKKHLKGYSELPEVEMVAICGTGTESAERLAAKYGIANVYSDYKEMLFSQKPDIVSICTPNFLHARMCIDSLRSGANVHCEKPLAVNAEEIHAIITEKDRSGKKLMVALNNRFTGEAAMIGYLVDSGFFGEIYHARCGWRRNSGIPGVGSWFTEKKLSGGGPLIDLGVHLLDMALYFMGYPKPFSVTGYTYSNFKEDMTRTRKGYKSREGGIFDVEDTAVGIVRLRNNATVDFEFSWAGNIEKDEKYLQLMGTKGGAILANGEVKLFTHQDGECITTVTDINKIPVAHSEFMHFADCVRKGMEPMASPEQAYELMKVIDALYASASYKREIVLD